MFKILFLFLFLVSFSYSEVKSESNDTFNNILNISTHNTNYFLPLSYTFKGKYPKDKRAEIKFQISIKKPLFENLLSLDEVYYFAYTQKAWWQAYKNSAPFKELNFQPEFFILFPLKFENFSSLKNLSISLLHESNGKDNSNLESRSWNRIYASFVFSKNNLTIVPRIWYRIPEKSSKDDNKDILNYMGNFDLLIKYNLSKDFFTELILKNNLNFKNNKLGLELNTGFDFFDNGVFYYLKYYYGYGENLTNYNRMVNKLSIGFLIAY